MEQLESNQVLNELSTPFGELDPYYYNGALIETRNVTSTNETRTSLSAGAAPKQDVLRPGPCIRYELDDGASIICTSGVVLSKDGEIRVPYSALLSQDQTSATIVHGSRTIGQVTAAIG